jgi:hypothetical protein
MERLLAFAPRLAVELASDQLKGSGEHRHGSALVGARQGRLETGALGWMTILLAMGVPTHRHAAAELAPVHAFKKFAEEARLKVHAPMFFLSLANTELTENLRGMGHAAVTN